MNRIFPLLVGVSLLASYLSAQPPTFPEDSVFLEINDIRARVNLGGDLFWDGLGFGKFEVPQGSGKNALFATQTWIGGLDESGQLRMAGQTYRQSGKDFWPGPAADTYDSAYFARYGKVWRINEDQILTHQTQFDQPGYQTPEDIATWPGNGDSTNGEPWQLAPFFDANSNGVYEPGEGDHPEFPGQQVVYQLYSDAQFPNTETMGESLGVDVHLMLYAYDAPNDPALDQSVFLSHHIVNRSNQQLSELYLGIWEDIDLGFFADDYMGCDSSLNLYYGYNADSLDNLPNGYGTTPPVMGTAFLNQDMAHFRQYLGDFSAQGNPQIAAHFYGYLQNLWKDSTVLTLGGTGYGGTVPINYVYPGDPADTSQWSEGTAGLSPGDRRGLGSCGPFTLPAGGTLCVDVALIYARADSGDQLASLPLLRTRTQEIQTFYEGNKTACDLYPDPVISNLAQSPVPFPLQIFPNPTSDWIHIQPSAAAGNLEIMDLQGKLLLARRIQPNQGQQISLKDFPDGTYLLRFQQGFEYYSDKLVKR
ncbi:MAG: T9SS type A sorting domain-containing protein [Bacteroidota bacterium]